jgi:hypothetical protein
MRRLTIVFAILAMLAIAMPAAASDGSREDSRDGSRDDGSREGRGRVFGPYASASADSGTCGNDWANDTFDRYFTVTKNADGTYYVREDYREGRFVTIAGVSPGACNTSPIPVIGNGSTIGAGVRGQFSGFLAGQVTGGTYQAAGGCPAPCNGDTFIATHFGAAVWSVAPFRFRYEAESDGLRLNKWQNASPDQGGNQGDIAN